jgi:hypothetical protein
MCNAAVSISRRSYYAMSTAVQQVLEAFNALSEADQHQAAVEILRQALPAVQGDVPEAALVEAAEELFRALDADEAGHAPR